MSKKVRKKEYLDIIHILTILLTKLADKNERKKERKKLNKKFSKKNKSIKSNKNKHGK